jgi:hypothetical protein
VTSVAGVTIRDQKGSEDIGEGGGVEINITYRISDYRNKECENVKIMQERLF